MCAGVMATGSEVYTRVCRETGFVAERIFYDIVPAFDASVENDILCTQLSVSHYAHDKHR